MGPLGDPNAAIDDAEPRRYRPQFGGYGAAPAQLSVLFTNASADESATPFPTRRRRVPVQGTRSVRLTQMVRNSTLAQVRVDPVTAAARAHCPDTAATAVLPWQCGPVRVEGGAPPAQPAGHERSDDAAGGASRRVQVNLGLLDIDHVLPDQVGVLRSIDITAAPAANQARPAPLVPRTRAVAGLDPAGADAGPCQGTPGR